MEEKFLVKKSIQDQKHVEVENRLKAEIDELTISLNKANERSIQLLLDKKSVEDELSCSIEVNLRTKIVSLHILYNFFCSILKQRIQATG